MRISDWSSDVCSSDLLEVEATEHGVSAVHRFDHRQEGAPGITHGGLVAAAFDDLFGFLLYRVGELAVTRSLTVEYLRPVLLGVSYEFIAHISSEEHTSELQSLMSISYAVF